jgi:cobalt-zinc-cadmium efflux system membrane fusion protein
MTPTAATHAPAEPPIVLQPVAHPPPHRPRFPGWAAAVLLAAAAGAAGFAAGHWLPAERSDAGEREKGEAKESPSATGVVPLPREKWAAAGIKCEPAGYGPLTDRAWRTGAVQFDHDRVAHLVCPVEGLVRETRADHGQQVKAGDVLAVIDSREVGQAKLDLAKTRLALEAARAQLDWTNTVTANAEELWKELAAGKPVAEIEKRFQDRPLGEWREKLVVPYSKTIQLKAAYEAVTGSGAGAVPEATVRKARGEYEAAAALYQAAFEEARYQARQQARAADQKYREAKAAADTARAHLLMIGYAPAELDRLDPAAEGAAVSHYPLKAPFSGTVIEKHAVRGERVVAQHQLFELADLSRVWVRADVFEADLPLVRGLDGRRLAFRAPNAGLPEREADLHFVGSVIDPASRALALVAEADNPNRELRPGMFVEVGLPRGTTGPVVHVPAAAVQRHDDRTFVFVRDGDAGFRRADVTVGRTVGDRVEITAGLQAGNEVATEGTFVLKTALLKDQIAAE